jgi:L-threonylcarbamoyladenylate synthase
MHQFVVAHNLCNFNQILLNRSLLSEKKSCPFFVEKRSLMLEQATATSLRKAAVLLKGNQVVAFPTETVYGLGANAFSSDAVKKIFLAKGRPSDNPLIVHVSSIVMLENLLFPQEIPVQYQVLLDRFWPGPLTILVPRPDSIPECVTAGQDTLAVRMPAHPLARELIELCGFPLAAPSANTSSRPSPTLAQHVLDDLKDKIPMILDGGPCQSGVESTVLDALRPIPAILRPGGVTYEMIKSIIPNVQVYRKDFVDLQLENAPSTPGMKYKHYSPNCDVFVVEYRDLQIQKSFIENLYQECVSKSQMVGILSVKLEKKYPLEIPLGENAADIAQNLFSALRSMEQKGVKVIIVQGIAELDEGLAVMNRIRKAASRCI